MEAELAAHWLLVLAKPGVMRSQAPGRTPAIPVLGRRQAFQCSGAAQPSLIRELGERLGPRSEKANVESSGRRQGR